MFSLSSLVVFIASAAVASAHTVITYPGWRGNNIHTNGTNGDGSVIPGSLGITFDNGTVGFPYGMQWMYPCGGMPTSSNRTKWPIGGGALAFQPGWFPGHSLALIYVNMGYGNEPLNMSHAMLPVFQIQGPSNVEYPGTVCLPQVPLPANFTPSIGDNATIQIIEAAQHGAALYNCVDITFADPADVANVNKSNCFNSSGATDTITFNNVYTMPLDTTSAAFSTARLNSFASIVTPLLFCVASLIWL